jgi:hypothetical protein
MRPRRPRRHAPLPLADAEARLREAVAAVVAHALADAGIAPPTASPTPTAPEST